MRRRIRLIMGGLFQRARFEREMADEMRSHVAAQAEELIRRGMAPAEAERRARAAFGSAEAAREDCRQARGLQWWDELRQDLRYALRQMVKTPTFTGAAIVSLALGIGANTAIYSLMDAVLFRSLPVADPASLYFLGHRGTTVNASTSSNYPLLERYQATEVFTGVTMFWWESFAVASGVGIERAEGQYVSGNYHAVVGAPFVAGRGFATEPDRPAGRAPVAVISDRYWARRFARSPDVVGQTVVIGGRPVTIVGVTAHGFTGLVPGANFDITLPLYVKALDEPAYLNARDGWTSGTIVARLRPGVTEAQASATVGDLFRRYWMEPENAWARGDGPSVRTGALIAAGKGTARLRVQYQTPLRVLMAMVGVVLLIACSNVANLLLARATVRAREVSLRMSIGASRARLIRQFLTESLLLALAGGALGLFLAMAGTRVIVSLLAVGRSPILVDVPINARVLGATAVVSVLTGVAFGLAPALRATRVDLARALKDGDARSAGVRLGAGKSLVALQLALCVLLVATAGLLVRSLNNLKTIDTGFARENIVMFNIETDHESFTSDRRGQFYSALLDRLEGLPGVLSASLAKRSPIDFSSERRGFEVPGVPRPRDGEGVSSNAVSPGYFPAFGIRLVRGRGFTAADRPGAPNVAIVSESMARDRFGGADPIGRTMLLGGNKTPLTVVGIAADVRHERLREEPPPMVYTPLAQPGKSFDGRDGLPQTLTVVIRTSGKPTALTSVARQAVRSLSGDVTMTYVRTMEQQVEAALVRERLLARLAGAFGVLALALGFVGLYGLMSYSVAQRTREIGIRMALGATRPVVLWGVLRETLVVAAAGIVIGLAVALATTKVVSTFLFGLSARDPATMAAVAAILLTTALVAGYLPARRAARLEPTRALRSD